MLKWFAYDLFTEDRYGPFDTEVEAILATRGKDVTIRCLRRGKRK